MSVPPWPSAAVTKLAAMKLPRKRDFRDVGRKVARKA
jgi:hypothetical protein